MQLGPVLLKTALVSLALAMAASMPASAEDRGLIIAVGDYPQILIDGKSGTKNLKGPLHDAELALAFATEVLGIPSGNVRSLINSAATIDAVRAGFRELVEKSRPGDRVLVHFSGHGVQILDADGDEADDDGLDEALVVFDSGLRVVDGEFESEPTNLLIDDEIGRVIGKIEGRDVTIVVDACHSGTVERDLFGGSGDGDDGDFQARTVSQNGPLLVDTRSFGGARLGSREIVLRQRKPSDLVDHAGAGVAVWSAAAAAQLAFESPVPQPNAGIFTRALYDGAVKKEADADGNGQVIAEELFNFALERSKRFCDGRTVQCRLGLVPELKSSPEYRLAPLGKQAPAPLPDASPVPAGALEDFGEIGLNVRILPSDKLQLGGTVRFEITADQAAHAVIFALFPSGNVTQIFPNPHSLAIGLDDKLLAGQKMLLPDDRANFRFTIEEKGASKLLTIATEESVDLSDLAPASRAMELRKKPAVDIASLLARIKQVIVSDNPEEQSRRPRYGIALTPYVVE